MSQNGQKAVRLDSPEAKERLEELNNQIVNRVSKVSDNDDGDGRDRERGRKPRNRKHRKEKREKQKKEVIEKMKGKGEKTKDARKVSADAEPPVDSSPPVVTAVPDTTAKAEPPVDSSPPVVTAVPDTTAKASGNWPRLRPGGPLNPNYVPPPKKPKVEATLLKQSPPKPPPPTPPQGQTQPTVPASRNGTRKGLVIVAITAIACLFIIVMVLALQPKQTTTPSPQPMSQTAHMQPESTSTPTPSVPSSATQIAPLPTPNIISQEEVNAAIQKAFPTIRATWGEARNYSYYPSSSFKSVAIREKGRLASMSAKTAAEELYRVLGSAFSGAAIGLIEENRNGQLYHYVIFISRRYGQGEAITYFITPRTAEGGMLQPCYNPVRIRVD